METNWESKMGDISNYIINGIRDINTGTNGAIRDSNVIDPSNIAGFLKTPRGLSLVFDAMNQLTPANKPFFEASPREWQLNTPIRTFENWPVVDCHVHYIQQNLTPGRAAYHPDDQYRNHAFGYWWFYPEAFSFSVNGATIQPNKAESNHTETAFENFMVDAHRRLNGNFQFFITPAPYQRDPMTGVSGIAAYEDMKRVSKRINKDLAGLFQRTASQVFGVITTPAAQFHPPVQENDAKIWKVYPGMNFNWGPEGKKWLTGPLSTALSGLPNGGKGHTICIHWWDGADPPCEKDLGLLVDAHKNINFVVFHACYPHYSELSDLIKTRTNLYAEIGGVFSHQIMGSDGRVVLGGVEHTGPGAAREMLNVLRRPDRENDEKIIWGTDAIWRGSPLWPVEAFKRLHLIGSRNTRDDNRFKQNVLSLNAGVAFKTALSL